MKIAFALSLFVSSYLSISYQAVAGENDYCLSAADCGAGLYCAGGDGGHGRCAPDDGSFIAAESELPSSGYASTVYNVETGSDVTQEQAGVAVVDAIRSDLSVADDCNPGNPGCGGCSPMHCI